MRMSILLPALLITLSAQIVCAQQPKLQVVVLESSSDGQSYDVPARVACVPGTYGPICGARGAETVSTYTVRVKARVLSSGAGMWLTCELRKKGDEKHCSKLLPGTFQADAKGNDKVIIYAWANPIYRGDLSKANKLEYRVGGRELDKDESAGATK